MPRKADALKTRGYVTRDPHTVALLKPDALERLGKWLAEPGAPWRGVHSSTPTKGHFWIGLESGPISYAAVGKTLADAISAALDQAEAK